MPTKAIHFEALKCALRQGKDGVILSLVVHPNDLPAEILSAPIGQQWIVALAPYVESPSVTGEPSGRNGSLLPVAEGVTPKQRYAQASEGEKAVTRAALLCKDPAFLEWIGADNELGAAAAVCLASGVKSRSDIAKDPTAFLALETEFLMATGRIASPS